MGSPAGRFALGPEAVLAQHEEGRAFTPPKGSQPLGGVFEPSRQHLRDVRG